jgi:oligosaccharide repeat unit polymerase
MNSHQLSPAKPVSKPVPIKESIRRAKRALTNPYVPIPRRILDLSILVVAGYLLMLYAFAFTSEKAAPMIGLRMLVVTVYVLISTSPLWLRRKEMGLFHPLYIFSVYTFLKSTVPNARVWADGVASHTALRGMSANAVTEIHIQLFMLLSLSWICMFIGFALSKGLRWRFITFRDRKRLLIFGSVLCTVIGVAALFLLMDLSGGMSQHLKNITRGHSSKIWVKDAEFASVYAVLVNLTIVAPAIWILKGNRPFLKPLLWILIAISICCSFLVNGRRSAVLMVSLVLVACWILRRRSLAIGRLAVIGIFLFAMVSVAGEFRRSNWSGSAVNYDAVSDLSLGETLQQSLEELESRREAGAVYPIIAYVPSREPFLIGKNYLDYVNRFIPRFIWKDKPRGIGIECARVFYGRTNSGGIPPGGLGEAYWSGGVLGVIIVFLLWGAVLKSLGNFFKRFSHSATASMLYLASVGTLGPSEPQFRAWLYMVAPAIILLGSSGLIKLAGRGR